MTKDEALKMALEVMRNQGDVSVDEWIATEKAIKEALANEALDKMAENARELGLDYEPPQSTWIDLTRNEILELLNGFYADGGRSEREIAFARVIQRALKEKNVG